MGLFSTSRPMLVDKVQVINGVAGDDWLYAVKLSPRRPGDLPVEVTDWGRYLKVPRAGDEVTVRALNCSWRRSPRTDEKDGHQFIALEGLGHVKGPKVETGHVGLPNYLDTRDTGKLSSQANSISIPSQASSTPAGSSALTSS